MKIYTVSAISDERWDRFVNQQPSSTIFHHSAWAKVLRDRYGREPQYIVEEDNGEIVAGIPFFLVPTIPFGKRLVSLPCSEYCFPLGSQDSISRLLSAVRHEVSASKASFAEIRGWRGPAPDQAQFSSITKCLGHITTLCAEPGTLRTTLEKGNNHLKRNLKRAEASALNIREAKDEGDLRQFHKLTVETRRRLHLLPWPYRYLESIYRHLVLGGHGFLLLAELNGQIIAGSMYFVYKDNVLLKFNASRKEFADYRPNYLITWRAMERSCIEGRKFFDFGVTDLDNEGLLSFKRQWATNEIPVPYYYYPSIRGANSLPRTGLIYNGYLTFNKVAPQFLLDVTARVLHRHLG